MTSKSKDLNLTFSGCGFLGIYHLGVVSCLKDNAPAFIDRVKCFGGASAGTFAAAGLVLNLNISHSAEFVLRLAKRAKSLTLGPLHPNFRVLQTLRRSFEKILPENAHELANGRLHVSLTRCSDLSNVIISEFFSKEDLIEALMASSHVPFWSSVMPAKFRGQYYIDGGISDNLPQHFSGETITVSPFSGESDICPNDQSPNFAHFDIRNTSVQFTLQNLYRCSRAFFPPESDVLIDMCKQGYRDTMKFLQLHYPETLATEPNRRTPSMSASMPHSEDTILSQSDSCTEPSMLRRTSTSSISAYSTCSNGEPEAFTATEVTFDDEQEEVDENESRLVTLLHRTSDAVTEAELWSCYVIRRIMMVVNLATTPCVFTMKQINHLAHIVIDYLPIIEKTGLEYLDHLLEMIYMVVHTYLDKHEIHDRRMSVVCSPKRRKLHHAHRRASAPSRKGADYSISRVNSDPSTASFVSCNSSPNVTNDSTSEESDIEILHNKTFSGSESYEFCSQEYTMLASISTIYDSPEEFQHELGQWESEGGACHMPVCQSNEMLSDDYVVLDGYESDVESDYDGFESPFETSI